MYLYRFLIIILIVKVEKFNYGNFSYLCTNYINAFNIFYYFLLLTGNKGAPFTQTLSANLTLDGFERSLALLLADKRVDLRAPCCSVG